MADNAEPGPAGAGQPEVDQASEQLRPVVTRREFMAGAGAGLAVGAVVAGGIAVATRSAVQTQPSAVVAGPGGPAVVVAQPAAPAAPAQAQPQATAQPQTGQVGAKSTLPLSMRTVELNIDGVARTVTVDVRESLWEAMI